MSDEFLRLRVSPKTHKELSDLKEINGKTITHMVSIALNDYIRKEKAEMEK